VRLSAQLATLLPDGVALDAEAIEAQLSSAIAEARARWPAVILPEDAFVAWIASRVPAGPTIALEGLRLADLYLACACARGDAKALAAFDQAFLARDTQSSDDVKQMLRQKLFVANPDGAAPRITLYAGRGDLVRWVRAATTRLAIDVARTQREVPIEDALMDKLGLYGVPDDAGPERGLIKQDSRAIVQASLREAIATLSDRERTMLLHYYIDNIGLAALGKLFELAPSNVSRTLAKARLRVVAELRRSLLRHHQIHAEELDSLVELVQSQLSLTADLRA
jgi:RNA polymerase sigma-70 factor, ECF subfamily